ncbi:MAG: hypothetical protein WB217_03595 [Mesobacillus sp.]|uniref:hypothetical protein n=1 Tax=Mesobacillus sp. TaxID=2675271 RepID=UPI003C5F6059
MENKNDELVFNSISKILLVLFISLIGSAVPVWSFTTFKIQLAILFIGILIAVYWYRTIEDGRKYNLFAAADMIVLMGFFAIVPVLRLTFGTIVFCVFLITYLLFLFHSIFKSIVLHRLPAALKYLPAISLSGAVILLLSAFFLRDTEGAIIVNIISSSDGSVILAFLLYVIGVLMTWLGIFVLREFFEKPPEKKRNLIKRPG